MEHPVDLGEPGRIWEAVTENLAAYLNVFPRFLDPKKGLTERVIEVAIESTADSLARRVKLLMKCESPIECLFALALNDILPHVSAEESIKSELILATEDIDYIIYTPWPELLAKHLAPAFTMPTTWDNQVALTCNGNNYRADFMFVTRLGSEEFCTVVELDGHEFHEKTKAQAERDKKRDRDMTAAGIRVIRFTGSEVWRDPLKCAVEALASVNLAAIDWMAKMRRANSEADTQEA